MLTLDLGPSNITFANTDDAAVEAPVREAVLAILPQLRSTASSHRETARPSLRARKAALLRERLTGHAAA